MERSFVFRKISRGKSVPYYHVHPFFQNLSAHFRCKFCRISIISIQHKVTLCIYVTKHASDYIALSLLTFVSYNGTCLTCDLVCSISGIIIIYIYGSFRKCFFGILHDLGNRLTLIIAGYQYRYFIYHFNFSCKVTFLLYTFEVTIS